MCAVGTSQHPRREVDLRRKNKNTASISLGVGSKFEWMLYMSAGFDGSYSTR